MEAAAAGGADAMVTMEFSELEGILRPILADAVQDAPSTSGVDADQVTQRALAKLWRLIHDSNEDRAAHLAGVPLPDVGVELLPLQREVDAVLARLNARRAAVPAAIEAATRAALEAQRACAGAPVTAADGDETAAAAGESAAPEVEQLLKRATAASDRLPAVRARLDEALHRLQANLAALGDGGAGARASPRTVEKAMLRAARVGERAGGGDQEDGGPRAAQQQQRGAAADGGGGEAAEDGESGADATRRCLARELLA